MKYEFCIPVMWLVGKTCGMSEHISLDKNLDVSRSCCILSGICSDILFAILYGTPFDIHSDILADIFSDLLSGCLSDMCQLSNSLTIFLASDILCPFPCVAH